jgi:serpin B
MKTRCMLAGLALLTVAAPASDPAVMRESAAASNRFAGRLYGRLAGVEQGNFVVSPFSAHSCLAMVALGAAGDTETQMRAALQLSAEPAARAAALHALRTRMDILGAAGDVTLESANRVWVQASYELRPEFTRGVQETLGAAFAAADFMTATEPARREINGWVEKKTRDRIKGLIPEGALTPDTRMVLVNAVYFYGAWNSPFPREQTREEPFHVSPERTRPAPMMNATLKAISYREEDGLQICELPYKGRQVTMVVLLPAAGGLPALEARLAKEGVDAVCGAIGRRDVQVTLPKFKLESKFGLNDPLIALGMRDAFEPGRADFSGMTGTRELFVSAVIQKAFIEVNEKGTEAAAATGAIMTKTSVRIDEPPPAVFRADRPFVFVLRDRVSGAVLFLGRVANPAG